MDREPDLFGEDGLPSPPHKKAFDGETYSAELDYKRLRGQILKVYDVMRDGRWHSLAELAQRVDGSEAWVSARIRDFRKEKYGSRTVLRRRVAGGGFYWYRLVTEGTDDHNSDIARSGPNRG
jgi:hypothetical protein